MTTDEERKQREQRDMVLTVVGVALLAVAGWYLAPLLVAAVLGVVGARLWRRVSGASGSSPRLLGAVVGCGVGVALVAAVLPSPAWIGDYDYRLRAVSVPEMRQARAEAHRQARSTGSPYQPPAALYAPVTPWQFHARAALTGEVIARAALIALGLGLAGASVTIAWWRRREAARQRRMAPPQGDLTTGASGKG